MSKPLVVRAVLGNYPHVQPIKDGSVKSERLQFDFVEIDPLPDAFRRMVRDSEFDICEMALTTHALAHAFNKPTTAIPVILHRNFHHAAIACAKGAALKGPAELAGRKVGVRAYAQTTGVWVRGILASEYGLDLDSVTWVTTEDAHVAEYRDPPNVIRAAPGKGLRAMLLSGEVDAVIGLRTADPAEVRTVIPDADKAAAAWYRKTGIYPANHAVVIRNDLLAAHPWLGTELMSLFAAAKAYSRSQGKAKGPIYPATAAQAWLADLVGNDPFPYGLAANRGPIDMLLLFAKQQKLTSHLFRIEELFDAKTMAWAA